MSRRNGAQTRLRARSEPSPPHGGFRNFNWQSAAIGALGVRSQILATCTDMIDGADSVFWRSTPINTRHCMGFFSQLPFPRLLSKFVGCPIAAIATAFRRSMYSLGYTLLQSWYSNNAPLLYSECTLTTHNSELRFCTFASSTTP